MGLLFIQSVGAADIPVMAAYLHADRAGLRRPSTWSSTCSTTPSTRGCGSTGRGEGGTEPWHAALVARAASTATSGGPSRARPVTVVSADRGAGLHRAARCWRRWIAPHNPFDLATLNLIDAFKPPAWAEGGEPRLPARHRRPGARRALGHHVRRAGVAAGRLLRGAVLGPRSASRVGLAGGLSRRHGGCGADAHRRHPADLPVHPDRAAGRRHRPRRAAARGARPDRALSS